MRSWAQTFTDERRALCKLEMFSTSPKPGANSWHTRDWSQLVEVQRRMTGLSVCRRDGRN